MHIEQHLQQLHEENEDCPDSRIMKQHKHCFRMWLKDQNLLVGEEKMMSAFVQSPSWHITIWQAYDINGFTFYTKAKGKKRLVEFKSEGSNLEHEM
jgi:pyridoxine/pyridoxamine 5'-phosphate oxidase